MNKGKSVFVTVLIAAMLVLIDIGLYIISKTGFVVLTGALAVYGYFRGAGDFWRWLAKEDKHPAAMKPVEIPQGRKAFDWQEEEVLDRKKTGPQVFDVTIIDEVAGYRV